MPPFEKLYAKDVNIKFLVTTLYFYGNFVRYYYTQKYQYLTKVFVTMYKIGKLLSVFFCLNGTVARCTALKCPVFTSLKNNVCFNVLVFGVDYSNIGFLRFP